MTLVVAVASEQENIFFSDQFLLFKLANLWDGGINGFPTLIDKNKYSNFGSSIFNCYSGGIHIASDCRGVCEC